MFEQAFLGQVRLGQWDPCDMPQRFMQQVAKSIAYANGAAQQAAARGDNAGVTSWANQANELSKEWEKWKKKYDDCLRARPVPTTTPVTPEPSRPGGVAYPVNYPWNLPSELPPSVPTEDKPPYRPFSPRNIPEGAYEPVPTFDRSQGMAPSYCPPGQFWDGRKCRGSVDSSASGLISSAISMAPQATSTFQGGINTGYNGFTGGNYGYTMGSMLGRHAHLGQDQDTPLPERRRVRDVLPDAKRLDLVEKFRRVWAVNPGCIVPKEKADPAFNLDQTMARLATGEDLWSDDWPPLIAKIEACYAALPQRPEVPGWALPVGIGVGVVGLAWYLSSRK